MLPCPGCGSNLTYDIDKGRLFCAYCRSDFEPTDGRLKQTAASEQDTIDAKIFSCPQCGGEMFTTDVDATAYCSYCGASNVLQSRIEGIDAPRKIIPFSVTRNACVETFNKLAKGTLYAPREFRGAPGEGKLRPLYVPYRVFNFSLNGNTTIYGKKTEMKGAYRFNKDCRIDCSLDADFHDLAYDASSAFDDTLAEQIAPFDMKKAQDFDTVYLAGAYANIPDVDEETYRKKALEYMAQKSIDALDKKETFSSTELTDYPDGSPLTEHLPIQKETGFIALLPVWFMSFRRGNRIAYAAVNGMSGKVYSDIPISLPAFWAGSITGAVPIFILLNMFLTLQPKNTLFAASLLALAGAALYAGSYISIMRREKHLDDAGYRSRGSGVRGLSEADSEGAGQGARSRLGQWITGRDKAPAVRLKKGPMYYAFKAFTLWPYILLLILSALFVPPVFGAILAAGCTVYCLRKGKGRISFWSGLLIAAAAAGLVMRELPLVSDLWYYGGAAAIFLIIVIALMRLVQQYNLLSTRPLPLLFKDAGASAGGGRDGNSAGGGRGKPGAAMGGMLVLAAGAMALQLLVPFGARAGGSPEGILYTNAETGYKVVILDREDLLTKEEESMLSSQMQDLTRYGNAVFVSCSQDEYEETLEYAKNWYYGYFGNESGTALVIDMGQRMVALYSAGSNYKVIGREEGYVITDNIYRYASKGDYYGCAESAFAQVWSLLEGGRIARPMKYVGNALLALILAVLINYGIISAQAAKRRAGKAMVSGDANYVPKVKAGRWSTVNTVKVLSFTGICTVIVRLIIEGMLESSGSGSSGGHSSGGGSSGGGASGGGGSHRF